MAVSSISDEVDINVYENLFFFSALGFETFYINKRASKIQYNLISVRRINLMGIN